MGGNEKVAKNAVEDDKMSGLLFRSKIKESLRRPVEFFRNCVILRINGRKTPLKVFNNGNNPLPFKGEIYTHFITAWTGVLVTIAPKSGLYIQLPLLPKQIFRRISRYWPVPQHRQYQASI